MGYTPGAEILTRVSPRSLTECTEMTVPAVLNILERSKVKYDQKTELWDCLV